MVLTEANLYKFASDEAFDSSNKFPEGVRSLGIGGFVGIWVVPPSQEMWKKVCLSGGA